MEQRISRTRLGGIFNKLYEARINIRFEWWIENGFTWCIVASTRDQRPRILVDDEASAGYVVISKSIADYDEKIGPPVFVEPDWVRRGNSGDIEVALYELVEAAKNAQRCLIPVTGFFEWRWLDEAGTVKIPYYVTFRDQKVRSMGGLYSRWRDKATDEYHYTYTVLTTRANSILEYVHNNKKCMPLFTDKENEKDWLSKDLSKDSVLDLCQPSMDPAMRAYTVSKLLTTRNINNNVPEVLAPMNYEAALQEAHKFLQQGEKKKALQAFKNSISTLKLGDLEHAAGQDILAELSL